MGGINYRIPNLGQILKKTYEPFLIEALIKSSKYHCIGQKVIMEGVKGILESHAQFYPHPIGERIISIYNLVRVTTFEEKTLSET